LWGDHGQAALEAAKICLINATATGTEILKNLILPGLLTEIHRMRQIIYIYKFIFQTSKQ